MVEKKHYYCGHSAKHFCTKWCIVGCHLIYCHVSLKQNYEKASLQCTVYHFNDFSQKCNIQGDSWRDFSLVKMYCGLTFYFFFSIRIPILSAEFLNSIPQLAGYGLVFPPSLLPCQPTLFLRLYHFSDLC